MKRLIRLVGAVGLLIVVGVGEAAAQSTADSYFHEAAQQYIAGNDVAARRAVAEGLRKAPSDPRLTALRKKLQEESRSKDKQDNSASNQNKQSQRKSSQSGQNTSEGENKPSQSEEGEKSQSGSRTASNNSSQSGQQSGQQSGEGGGQSERREGQTDQTESSESFSPTESTTDRDDRRGGGPPRDTLSRAQAERLLQALEGQERQLLRQLQGRSATETSVEKDW